MSQQLEKYRMVPMILVMGTIFFLSHQSGDVVDIGYFPGIDKVAHCLVYGLLAATVIVAHGQKARSNKPLMVSMLACVVCLLYGLSDEFHQSFIPGRFVSGGDILADMVGAVAVSAGWFWGYRKLLVSYKD